MSGETIVDISTLPANIQSLIQTSVTAREFAYAPYSNFKVGAALLADDGVVYTGCNVENIAYGGTICAERTAVCKAVSEGKQKYSAIAIAALNADRYTSPCGPCRQFLAEFGVDTAVYLTIPGNTNVLVTTVDYLLPLHFIFSDKKFRKK